jgi:DNA-binding XRE family transcriptional regulator
MSKKITTKPNLATQWFDDFVDKNQTEILINKAILEIACKIKQEREKQGLSQRDMATKTGLTQTTILRLEKGKNSNLETMIRVASAMGLTPRIEFVLS